MKPTDEQLNRVAAGICNRMKTEYGVYYPTKGEYSMGYSPGFARDKAHAYQLQGFPCEYAEREVPDPEFDPCNDRNDLPELWSKVQEAGQEAVKTYLFLLTNLYEATGAFGDSSIPAEFIRYTAPPRLHVIAALEALDKWQEEWDA